MNIVYILTIVALLTGLLMSRERCKPGDHGIYIGSAVLVAGCPTRRSPQ